MKIRLFVLLFFATVFFGYTQTPENVGPRANTGNDPANGIYVSPDGYATGATGAIDKPYKSINAALTAAAPGATIILRGGTYCEGRRVRVQKSNITIKSAKGEWAVIDLTSYDPGNQEHSGVEFYAEDQITRDIVRGCKLQNVEVKGGYYAVCFETKWDWGQADRSGASDIIVEDCILHHSTDDVVKVKPGCKNITIRYNEIHNSGQNHISHSLYTTGQRNAEGIDNVNGDRMYVHNNYIHDICSNGIYAKGGATDVIIENNIIERTYAGGIQLGFDTGPRYFDTTVNPNYYENINGIVRNNLVRNTGWEGIGLYASKDACVYNNTIVNATGYGTAASAGIVRSPIYFGIATQDEMNPTGCPANVNPNIHHNISVQPSTFNNRMVEIRYATINVCISLGPPQQFAPMSIAGLSGNPAMNYNCYYVAGKNATFTDNRPTAVKNMNLAAWRNHIGDDYGSIEADPALDTDYITTNPLCSGMGIQAPLIINIPTDIAAPVLLPEISAFGSNGILTIQSPVAETVQVYSSIGALLFNFRKPEGKVGYAMEQSKGSMILIRGSSGWTTKLIVQ